MRRLYAAGYYISWLIPAAILFSLPVMIIWERLSVPIDDDVTLLCLPIGAALGIWAAIRSRRSKLFHALLFLVGIIMTAAGILMAIHFFHNSRQQIGVSGPFSGFPEFLSAWLSIIIAVIGAFLMGIWPFAKLAKF